MTSGSGWPGTDWPASHDAAEPSQDLHSGSEELDYVVEADQGPKPVGPRSDSDADWAGPAYSAGSGQGFNYGSGSGV